MGISPNMSGILQGQAGGAGAGASTGATAGIPGAFTPAGSSHPTMAGMIAGTPNAVTASPATAWTTGQYVQTRDRRMAKWNGTAWTDQGAAPMMMEGGDGGGAGPMMAEPTPDSSWTKAQISDWLTAHGIDHDPNALKADLLALVP